MATINFNNRSIIDVNINGKEEAFIINYNENNIVTSLSIIDDDMAIELYSFSKFKMFENIHIDDMDDNMIKLIYDFNKAWHNVYSAILKAEEYRKYAEDFGLE